MSDPLAPLREKFRARLASDRAELETLAAMGMQGEALRCLVHSLAGTAGMFGFSEISAAAGEIDDQLAAGLSADANSLDRLIVRMRAVDAPKDEGPPAATSSRKRLE